MDGWGSSGTGKAREEELAGPPVMQGTCDWSRFGMGQPLAPSHNTHYGRLSNLGLVRAWWLEGNGSSQPEETIETSTILQPAHALTA